MTRNTAVIQDAETYLRLMAEAELRRALKLRPIRPPARPRLLRQVARVASFSRMRSVPLRWLLRMTMTVEAQLRTGWRRNRPPAARAGLDRLSIAAEALSEAGAIDATRSDAIVADYQLALVLRSRLAGSPFGFGWLTPRRQSARSQPAGPVSALRVAATIPLALDGQTAEVTLHTLIIGAAKAVLTISARPPQDLTVDDGESGSESDEDYVERNFLFDATATDDRGGRYEISVTNDGDEGERWTGQLELTPAPAPGTRWLDVIFWPGTDPARISLSASGEPPATAVQALTGEEQAEWYLGAVADQLLRIRKHAAAGGSPELPDLPVIVSALVGAGVVEPDGEGLRRLATLGRRLHVDLPPALTGLPDAELTEPVRDVLDQLAATDGPSGTVVAAAALPEFSGAYWVITQLESSPDGLRLQLLGWNVRTGAGRQRMTPFDETIPGGLTIWARDDTGRWHFTEYLEGNWDDDEANLDLKLSPPIDPAASSLEIIVTGRGQRVTVTLPLRWFEPA